MKMYQQLPDEITLVDTGLFKDGTVACYLLESDGEVAIIETGNYQTTQRLLDLLEQKNIHREKVRYVIPTHVHLDHAGGSGSLIENLPNSMLVIHPRGARHMIDPSKLIAGAQAVYGEEKFREYYGDIKGIAEERMVIAEDNDQLTFGNRTLLFKDTPGHANHHFCVWDEQSAGWFTGDTFGIAYAQFSKRNIPLLFPTTTPVQFNPAQLIDSVKMMMSYQPKQMYLTHFGAIDVTGEVADALCKKI
ncbi:MAG: MBL fold metallo-hydrolase, partial [Gammaproteobacteria bacterium]|nr:MBL fold metallo-hydrolase [Gammaproteobacteria bacterium]